MRGKDGKKKVLITGAAGLVGSTLYRDLRDRYDLWLMIHQNRGQFAPEDDVVAGSILDFDATSEFVKGCDVVVHLADIVPPDKGKDDFATMQQNIAGAYNVVEACRLSGVGKLVFASTNHVAGMYERDGLPCDPDLPVRPDGYYGAGKAAAEALYRYYSDQHGLSIIAIRIGSFWPPFKPVNHRSLASWLSPRDCSQLFWRAVEADVRWAIVYGISGNTRRYWSIESAQKLLGYAPEDDSEQYYDEVVAKEAANKA
jgi:nucleoside-diphosphate-sugar epimerase